MVGSDAVCVRWVERRLLGGRAESYRTECQRMRLDMTVTEASSAWLRQRPQHRMGGVPPRYEWLGLAPASRSFLSSQRLIDVYQTSMTSERLLQLNARLTLNSA